MEEPVKELDPNGSRLIKVPESLLFEVHYELHLASQTTLSNAHLKKLKLLRERLASWNITAVCPS